VPEPPAFAAAADETAAAPWRNKKHQLEQELEQLTAQKNGIEPHLTTCNRGGYLYMTQDNGLKKRISCATLRATLAELESRRASLHEYLEYGLNDECRRAGCLPGWLRD
jgi:BMFP domain-containing protein YqiC